MTIPAWAVLISFENVICARTTNRFKFAMENVVSLRRRRSVCHALTAEFVRL